MAARHSVLMFISKGQCLTRRKGRALKIAAVVGALSAAATPASDWPDFAPPRDALAPGIVSSIERVWSAPTLSRTVQGGSAPVPLATYDAFVDAPDVTAAAARHLKLAAYQVRVLDDDWYEADDGHGARGVYRVVARTPTRCVILSWGRHSGGILGTISGSALTVLDFEDLREAVGQKLTVYVLIENRVAATLAKALAPIFGQFVDRKLTEGFRVTSRVAEWAVSRPDEFCPWLSGQGLADERARRLYAAVECPRAPAVVTPPRP